MLLNPYFISGARLANPMSWSLGIWLLFSKGGEPDWHQPRHRHLAEPLGSGEETLLTWVGTTLTLGTAGHGAALLECWSGRPAQRMARQDKL